MIKNKQVSIRRIAFSVMAICVITIVFSLLPRNASAYSETLISSVLKKSLAYGVAQCYNDGYMKNDFNVQNWNGLTGLVNKNGKVDILKQDGSTVKHVSEKCKDVLNATGARVPQINSAYNFTESEKEAIGNFLVSVGYQPSAGQKCATFSFTVNGQLSTTKMCMKVDGNGKIIQDYPDNVISFDGDASQVLGMSYLGLGYGGGSQEDEQSDVVHLCFAAQEGTIPDYAAGNGYMCNSSNGYVGMMYDDGLEGAIPVYFGNGVTKFDTLVDKINQQINHTIEATKKVLGTYNGSKITNNTEVYVLESGAGKKAAATLTGISDYTLNNNEKTALLQYYLEKEYGYVYYKDKATACGSSLSQEEINAATSQGFKLVKISQGNSCYIKGPTLSGGEDKKVAIYSACIGSLSDLPPSNPIVGPMPQPTLPSIGSSVCADGDTQIGYDQLIQMLEAIAPSANDPSLAPPDMPGEGITSPDDPGSDDSNDPGANDIAACYGAAGVLGWIACPVLEAVGGVAGGLYNVIEGQLSVSSDVMSDNGLRLGWGQIRNLANILFAIAFVIVILAQITGIGISNYNVKKILPRLIMVVVLVNLSFIICQLAVDVSNILGESLKDMFDSWAASIPIGDASSNVGSIIGGILTGLGLSAGAIGVAGALGFFVSWETWLFPLLVVIFGVLISVLFFFLVIAVRQAGIVILIVLAPAAIICYALPNTQNIFKRWQKAFTSLLLVYPICGALMGGGAFAGRIILSAAPAAKDAGFLAITGMLVQVVPFFMIPAILRSSMAAIGNVGARITGLGQRFGRWGQERIGNTNRARTGREARQNLLNDRYQHRSDAMAERQLRRMRDRYDRIQATPENRRSRSDRRWLARNQDRYSRSILRYDAITDNQARLEAVRNRGPALEGTSRYDQRMASIEASQLAQDTTDELSTLSMNNAEVEMMDASGTGTVREVLNSSNRDQLTRTYEHLARRVIEDPNDRQALARMQAVQSLLMRQRDKGAEAIYNTMQKIQSEKDANGNYRYSDDALRNSALSRATSNLMEKHAGDMKTFGGKSMMLAMQDIASNDFSHRNKIKAIPGTDGRAEGYLSEYSAGDASSITEHSFNDLSDEWFTRTASAIKNGDMNAKQMQNLVTAATSYMSNDNIEKKGKVLNQVQSLLGDVYSSSFTANDGQLDNNGNCAAVIAGNSATLSSELISNAPSAAIDALANDVQKAGKWEDMSAEQQQKYANTIANVQYAYEHGTFSQGDAQQLQRILRTAQRNGYSDRSKDKQQVIASGIQLDQSNNIRIAQLAESSFKVDRSAPQRIEMPENWKRRRSDGVWINTTNNRKLTGEDLARANSIEQHNINIDIQNGRAGSPTPPPNP